MLKRLGKNAGIKPSSGSTLIGNKILKDTPFLPKHEQSPMKFKKSKRSF
jgi:hypothetical protein